jgi:hypothetical protein
VLRQSSSGNADRPQYPCSATLILAFFFILTLWWARKSWVAWLTIFFFAGLLVVGHRRSSFASEASSADFVCPQTFWLIADSVPLRFFILFMGVMSCFYSIWDIIDVGPRCSRSIDLC